MLYGYEITGETPSKKNSRITLRNGMSIVSARYRKWHGEAMKQLEGQAKPEEPITEKVKITMTFTHGDYRRRDSDNQASSILDVLQDSKVLNDDNWQIVKTLEINNTYDSGKPRVSIFIQGE